MTPALELADLAVHYGGVVALDGVSLTVHEGELVGLIGPNGAGKTTLIDAVTGFARYAGSVSVCGTSVDSLRPDQRAAIGLGRTFQAAELFDDLTVHENVAVGPMTTPASVRAALAGLGLSDAADLRPTALSATTCRLVGLARALAAQPRVLLLDEIAAGMDGDERTELAGRLRDIVTVGTGVLLVDHDLALVAEVSDRVVVLDTGRVIASGSADDVRRDEHVLAAYLGRQS